MIGMAGKNRHGPVDLLGGHDSRQLMRPSHRPKTERKRSRGHKSFFQTVRAADHECGGGVGRVPGAAKLGGKAPARHLLAVLVKSDHRRAWRKQTANGDRLLDRKST